MTMYKRTRRTISSLLIGAAVLTLAACNGGSSVSTVPEQKPASVEPAPASPPPTPSPWTVSTSTNDLTGELTVVAITGYGDQVLIIRRRGPKLDCYVKTGKFLETVDNMESRHMAVKYKFDDGEIVRQVRTISLTITRRYSFPEIHRHSFRKCVKRSEL